MNTTSNRRRDERLNKALPVFVRAQNPEGQRLKFTATTDNISQSGALIPLPDWFKNVEHLFAFISLSNSAALAVFADIVRSEEMNIGLIAAGIQFKQIKLFPIN